MSTTNTNGSYAVAPVPPMEQGVASSSHMSQDMDVQILKGQKRSRTEDDEEKKETHQSMHSGSNLESIMKNMNREQKIKKNAQNRKGNKAKKTIILDFKVEVDPRTVFTHVKTIITCGSNVVPKSFKRLPRGGFLLRLSSPRAREIVLNLLEGDDWYKKVRKDSYAHAKRSFEVMVQGLPWDFQDELKQVQGVFKVFEKGYGRYVLAMSSKEAALDLINNGLFIQDYMVIAKPWVSTPRLECSKCGSSKHKNCDKVRCFKCGNLGHFSYECDGKDGTNCFRCKQKHDARFCPEHVKKVKEARNRKMQSYADVLSYGKNIGKIMVRSNQQVSNDNKISIESISLQQRLEEVQEKEAALERRESHFQDTVKDYCETQRGLVEAVTTDVVAAMLTVMEKHNPKVSLQALRGKQVISNIIESIWDKVIRTEVYNEGNRAESALADQEFNEEFNQVIVVDDYSEEGTPSLKKAKDNSGGIRTRSSTKIQEQDDNTLEYPISESDNDMDMDTPADMPLVVIQGHDYKCTACEKRLKKKKGLSTAQRSLGAKQCGHKGHLWKCSCGLIKANRVTMFKHITSRAVNSQ